MYQPTAPRKLGSPPDAVSPLWARTATKIVIACGLALIALLASSSLAAASDPSGAVADLATQAGTETTSPQSASSEPEVTASTEPSLSAEVTASSEPEVTASTEPSLSAEVTASSEPSLSAEVTVSSEPSLSAEVTSSTEPGVTGSREPSLSLGVEPPKAPAAGEPPVEPPPSPDTLLAPVTELVADQLAAPELPDPTEFVAPSTPFDNLPLLSTDTPEVLGIADLGASEDAGEVVAALLAPAAQTSGEPMDGTDGPGTADPWTFSPVVIDGRDADGEPARRDAASETVINSTVRPLAAERGQDRDGTLASVAVPRIAAEGGGSGAGTSIPDPQFGVILAALACAAVWRLLALSTPASPTGNWVLATVPPG